MATHENRGLRLGFSGASILVAKVSFVPSDPPLTLARQGQNLRLYQVILPPAALGEEAN